MTVDERAVGGVAAALANWNGLPFIDRCLEALDSQTIPVREIVIVDNASTDGSREWIRSQYPQVRLLENEHNEGYAAGYNRAIDACHAPFVLLLNTDVFLAPDFVALTVACLAENLDTAAATGCLYQQATEEYVNGGFFLRRQIRIAPAPLDADEEVFGATGAAVLFRREALWDLRVGGEYFDASYFAYGEDIDLCWRAQLFGWKIRSLTQARATHVGSGSLQGRLRFLDKPARYQRHTLKNRYLTVIKNASPAVALNLLPAFALTELALWPFLLLRKPLTLPYLMLALVDVVRLLPASLRWRREVQRRRTVPSSHIRRHLRGI